MVFLFFHWIEKSLKLAFIHAFQRFFFADKTCLRDCVLSLSEKPCDMSIEAL